MRRSCSGTRRNALFGRGVLKACCCWRGREAGLASACAAGPCDVDALPAGNSRPGASARRSGQRRLTYPQYGAACLAEMVGKRSDRAGPRLTLSGVAALAEVPVLCPEYTACPRRRHERALAASDGCAACAAALTALASEWTRRRLVMKVRPGILGVVVQARPV